MFFGQISCLKLNLKWRANPVDDKHLLCVKSLANASFAVNSENSVDLGLQPHLRKNKPLEFLDLVHAVSHSLQEEGVQQIENE